MPSGNKPSSEASHMATGHTTLNSDSRRVLPTPFNIFFNACIQLRQLVPSQRGAINKWKGKTGKQRLFFIIHYMVGGFDLCVKQSRVKLCLSIIYRTGHRRHVSWLAQLMSEWSRKKCAGTGPPCLGIWLQVRVQEGVCLLCWAV